MLWLLNHRDTAPYPNSTDQAKPFIIKFNQVITDAKTANAGKYDWLIVQHHKSTASVAVHLADRDIQYYVEAGFERIMSEQKVDFVLAGLGARPYKLFLCGRVLFFISDSHFWDFCLFFIAFAVY